MRPKNCSGESGLTVVEVLVASVLMIMGILGVLAAFPQALGSARDSGRKLILNRLASQQLETLRALPYNDTDLGMGFHPAQQFDSAGDRYYPVTGLSEEYSMRWRVQTGPTDQSGTAEPNMKRVTVEATYETRYSSAGAPITESRSYETVFHTYVTD
jgi:hypothetical protein